ncbi:hypothetical protein CRUP_030622 [Coryphaenoides rupestris]|nr:hypothetical protein CRUP_030622 [Coryphaenoides rupestris]
MPGQANLVKELQEAFDCGDKPLFDSNTDTHTVASLLKLYLRELPEPVVQSHCNENKMSVQNLATVFGPNILRPKMEDPVAIMEVEGLLELLDQVGLAWHAEEALLVQAPVPQEVHALLHQQGGQPGAKLLLVLHRVLQTLAEDPCSETERNSWYAAAEHGEHSSPARFSYIARHFPATDGPAA